MITEDMDQPKLSGYDLDQYMRGGGFSITGKAQVWLNVALKAPDQLRQRVAWALSQIFVISEDQTAKIRENEVFHTYYDIFVRHAFGNFFDILKEVSYSPLMGNMLTYMNSKSLALNQDQGKELFPDENYAREIMQLFTIGLFKLNQNGTKMTDESGEFLPTYTNDDITSFARAWTGFTHQKKRGNIENYVRSEAVRTPAGPP